MDERQGRYSASGIEGISLCPGKANAERGLPETPTDDSKTGDLIHRYLAGEAVELDSDQQRVADSLRAKADALRDEYGFFTAQPIIERRLWWDNLFSGKADLLYCAEHFALIIDFKTGHNEVEEAASNLQLRTLAVLAYAELHAARIICAVVPAWGSVSLSSYDLDDIVKARDEIFALISVAANPDAPRIPGEKQCRYCKAKTVCDAFQKNGERSIELISSASKLPSIPAGVLATALDAIPLAEKYIETLKLEAKRRLAVGEDVPGWKLTQGKAREKIVNLPTVHARAESFGVTTEQFTEACSLTKKAAKEMLHKATARKGKLLEDSLDAMIAGCKAEGELPEPKLERAT